MDLIPHEELKPSQSFNFAPMIDFLFLMLCLFATLAISKAVLADMEIDLVQLKAETPSRSPSSDIRQINLTITADGHYKWLTEFQEYPMASLEAVKEELARQYQIGALPQDKQLTEVLLHIDEKAPWAPIAAAIFAIRELGFSARPVYEPGR